MYICDLCALHITFVLDSEFIESSEVGDMVKMGNPSRAHLGPLTSPALEQRERKGWYVSYYHSFSLGFGTQVSQLTGTIGSFPDNL